MTHIKITCANPLKLGTTTYLYNESRSDKFLRKNLYQKGFFIYKVTNLINNKFYIGKTTNFLDRFNRHYSSITNRNQHLYLSMNKHGIENFFWEIIDSTSTDKNQLNELEIYYIQRLNPELNMTKGGDGGGFKHSLESKEKMRIAALNRDPFSVEHKKNIGITSSLRIVSNETRQKQSKSHKGRVKSPEECLNISRGKKGKSVSSPSAETRALLSIRLKQAWERKRNEC